MNIVHLLTVKRLVILSLTYIKLTDGYGIGSLNEDIVEKFYYTIDKDEKNTEPQVKKEFFIVGRKVPWLEAKMLCSSFDDKKMRELTAKLTRSFIGDENLKNSSSQNNSTTLAVFVNENERSWLARMLSESNYRYEGLWIGGSRKDKSSSWYWIDDYRFKNSILSNNLVYDNYPSWYKVPEEVLAEQNCLLFNRIGHDVPVFIPENCHLPRPFICMRNAKNKSLKKIIEKSSVSIDGYRYTLYNVISEEDEDENYENKDVKKLNGGGITWKDAMIECEKRGQHLAMVLTNEAATAIADIMLKNRPSMENIWLGGWSLDGSEWTWISSGSTLSSIKSNTSEYPPWLEGHPVTVSKSDNYYQKLGRCLILDRHLCPEQIAPVFLDLDCEKERPFICQDGLFESKQARNLARRSIVRNEVYEFSEEKMTYLEGKEYCKERNGKIASILDSLSLSTCLDKMSELSIEHVWIGGRTELIDDVWRWVDDSGNFLSSQGIGTGISWCMGEENSSLPQAEPNSCLNLDYEARGFPLFYGLSCNSSQVVLCSSKYNFTDNRFFEASDDDVDTRIFGALNGLIGNFSRRASNTFQKLSSHNLFSKLNDKDAKKENVNNNSSAFNIVSTTLAPSKVTDSVTLQNNFNVSMTTATMPYEYVTTEPPIDITTNIN